MAVGYLAGAFDMLNVGDLDMIAQARELCECLVVGVYTDGQAERAQGRAPVVPLEERLEIVSHVRGVSSAVVHAGAGRPGAVGLTFSLTGLDDCDGGLVLRPRRVTSSAALRDALAPVSTEAVA